jgi:hypothetical protein
MVKQLKRAASETHGLNLLGVLVVRPYGCPATQKNPQSLVAGNSRTTPGRPFLTANKAYSTRTQMGGLFLFYFQHFIKA